MRNDSLDEQEIDLIELLYYYIGRFPLLIAAVICGALISGLFTHFCIPNRYTAVSRMYMVSASSSSVVNLADLNIGTSLSNDYVELMKTRPVIDGVIESLGLEYEYEKVVDMISLSVVPNTRIVRISVTNTSPQEAMDIANEVAKISREQLPKVMDSSTPSIVEEAILPERKSYPSLSRNTAVGALLAFLAVLGILTSLFLLDDTIRTPEDFEKVFGIIPLAAIPEGEIEGRKKSEESRKLRHFRTLGLPMRKRAETHSSYTAALPVRVPVQISTEQQITVQEALPFEGSTIIQESNSAQSASSVTLVAQDNGWHVEDKWEPVGMSETEVESFFGIEKESLPGAAETGQSVQENISPAKAVSAEETVSPAEAVSVIETVSNEESASAAEVVSVSEVVSSEPLVSDVQNRKAVPAVYGLAAGPFVSEYATVSAAPVKKKAAPVVSGESAGPFVSEYSINPTVSSRHSKERRNRYSHRPDLGSFSRSVLGTGKQRRKRMRMLDFVVGMALLLFAGLLTGLLLGQAFAPASRTAPSSDPSLSNSKTSPAGVVSSPDVLTVPVVVSQSAGSQGASDGIVRNYTQIVVFMDNMQRIVEERYAAKDGSIVKNEKGYAVVRNQYDDNGNLVRSAYYDEYDRPVLVPELGYSSIRITYDSLGNRTSVTFYDVDDSPVVTQ